MRSAPLDDELQIDPLIERKKAGEGVTVPPPGKEPPPVPHLMEALTRSLHTARTESR